MGRPRIPDEERERIIAAMREGKSRNQIAKEFGRAPQTIGNIAASVGHVFGQLNSLRAREARKAYGAEWRANAIAKWAKAHDDILDRLYQPTLVYSFGGRDNDYNEHTQEKPDAKTVRDIVNAAAVAWRTINDIDKADQGGANGAADELLGFFGALQQELGTEPDAEREPEATPEHRLE